MKAKFAALMEGTSCAYLLDDLRRIAAEMRQVGGFGEDAKIVSKVADLLEDFGLDDVEELAYMRGQLALAKLVQKPLDDARIVADECGVTL